LWHGAEPGDPWGERPDPALLRIGAHEVLAAVDGLQRGTCGEHRQEAAV
jgi:hypothetical protein